jgi:hypothetical protein
MTDLQTRFAEALRRELDGGAPGAPVVNVQPATVTVTPRVVAELPALPQPLEVADVDRFAGAWRYRMEVTRNSSGLIQTVEMQPTRFVSAEEIQK